MKINEFTDNNMFIIHNLNVSMILEIVEIYDENQQFIEAFVVLTNNQKIRINYDEKTRLEQELEYV